MKAITVCQPYASLIAIGDKLVENRQWATRYRGPLAIHAGKSRKMLRRYDDLLPDPMPFGAIVGVADLVECVGIQAVRHGNLPENMDWVRTHLHTTGPECLILANPRRLQEPIPCKGATFLWNLPSEIESKVSAAFELAT